MMDVGISKLKILSEIKKREVVLPIVMERVITKPLLVGDDLSIRSSVVSPDLYDMNITKMIYNHLEFPNRDRKPTFDEFISTITNVDRQCALWGILSGTYGKIENEEVTCNKCGKTFKITVPYDDLIHDDTFTLWNENKPHTEYVRTVEFDINSGDILKLEVDIGLLPISRRLGVMGFVTVDKIRENFNLTKTIFSLSEQMSTITKEIRVVGTEGTVKIDSIQEILIAYNNYLTYDIIEKIAEEFSYFNKYTPKFYVNITCNNCSDIIRYEVDMELGLFRSYLRWARS
ncbi:MAG: hypothetical protein QXD03_01805 [Candidatus Anstonellales archaeon]